MLIYLASPITPNTENGKTLEENIKQASDISRELWGKGHAVITPALNTAFVDQPFNAGLDPEFFYVGDFQMIAVCDAVVFSPDWATSRGATIERRYAGELAIPTYTYPDLPDLHVTEVSCPNQVKAFREELGRMYRTHLKKQADYGPGNIAGTGRVGLATRIFDKTSRLMRLTGFMTDTGEFVGGRDPANESLEDTYMDLAVYGVIARLFQRGVWGK